MASTSRVKNVIIGQAFQYKREVLDISRAKLAKRLEVKPQFVANWERGQCLPPKKILKKLADNLQMSQTDIIKLYTKATKIALEEFFDTVNDED